MRAISFLDSFLSTKWRARIWSPSGRLQRRPSKIEDVSLLDIFAIITWTAVSGSEFSLTIYASAHPISCRRNTRGFVPRVMGVCLEYMLRVFDFDPFSATCLAYKQRNFSLPWDHWWGHKQRNVAALSVSSATETVANGSTTQKQGLQSNKKKVYFVPYISFHAVYKQIAHSCGYESFHEI